MVRIYVKSAEDMKVAIYRKGMSVKTFSESCGINASYFSNMINGNRSVGAGTAKKIADALDVEMDELFDFRVPVK